MFDPYIIPWTKPIWTSTRENLSSGFANNTVADQPAQSDQHLCYALFEKYHMQTCFRWNFNLVASLCSWGDWFETRFLGNPEDRFSRDEAQLISLFSSSQSRNWISFKRSRINPFKPSGLAYPYQWDESISILGVLGGIFHFFPKF